MTGHTPERRSAGRTAGSAPAPRPGPRPPACRAPRVLQDVREQAGLADPGFALNEHDRWAARSNTVQGPRPGPRSQPHARRSAGPGPARPCPDGTAIPAGMPGHTSQRHGHGPGRAPLPGSAVTSVQRPQQPQPAAEADFLPRAGPGVRSGIADDPKTAAGGSALSRTMRISTHPIVPAPAAGTISQLADACDAGTPRLRASWPPAAARCSGPAQQAASTAPSIQAPGK